MSRPDNILYFVSAILQLAAMFLAIRMAREASDRRPWMLLFGALFIMFAFRVASLFLSGEMRQQFAPYLSVPISLLLLASLFFTRKISIAERESRAMAVRRTAERDESENRYRSLVDLSPDVIFVNAGGKFAYANTAALHFFGAKCQDELLGRSPLDFTSEGTRAIVATRIASLQKTGDAVPPLAEDWMRLDGSQVPVEAAAAVVPWKGQSAIQVILRDVSERKRAEDEKSHLLANERAARSEAEHASRMKDEFLATLSHELRTPLHAILGWTQLLRRRTNDDEEIVQGLETIERNARIQTRLIEDLLDMSRIVSGKLLLDIQRVDPVSVIRAAIETVRPAATAKGVRLVETLDKLGGFVSGDASRLQQIVWNLLSNAIKFTPSGGTATVALVRVESQIEITVSDTGEGIHSDFVPYIFDRFRQADAAYTRRHGGLGLGLAIVKQLVELHGGSVSATSPGERKGTTVTVRLPVAASQHVALDTQLRNTDFCVHAAEAPGLHGVRVLVVDDDADALEFLRRVLEKSGATVYFVESAAGGKAVLLREKPDVLVSDIGMPGRDGYEFIREVRALEPDEGGRVPAVALTAFARSEDRTRAILAGFQVHIAKPVEPRELIATIASLAGRLNAA